QGRSHSGRLFRLDRHRRRGRDGLGIHHRCAVQTRNQRRSLTLPSPGGLAMRYLIIALSALLLLALPVWPFSHGWGAAPALTVGFLLLINLVLFLFARGGDRQV